MSDKPVSDERKAEGFEPVSAVVARVVVEAVRKAAERAKQKAAEG